MAGQKLKISLSPISKEIDKATKALASIEKRVSVADKKKIKLEIKKFGEFKKVLLQACRQARMTQAFLPK